MNAVDSYSSESTVSISEVLSFVERDCPSTKGILPSDVSVVPYLDILGRDTLMYIVNYPNNQGWKILSADSRTPAIIAHGDSGNFSLEAFNGAASAWMGKVAEDMVTIRNSTNEELSFTEEQILLNQAFWTGNNPIKRDDSIPETRGGHWEVITTQEEIIDTVINHLTPKWDQESPYNEYCPYRVLACERAAAGCVAVAGAEVLYYLHGKFSVPTLMVSTGYCNGYTLTHGSNDHYFGNPTSSVWYGMNPDYSSTGTNLPEALMIGKIGHDVGMNYGESSWALPENLKTYVFEPNGISCTYSNYYNEYTVRNNLMQNIPVIITASNMVVPIDGHFHSFVADGYKIARIKYTHYHYWVKDGPIFEPEDPFLGLNPPSEPQGGHQSYYTYTYSLPYLSEMTINWGSRFQWTVNQNEGWYSFTAGWTIQNGNSQYDYNHNISMIYNFAIAD